VRTGSFVVIGLGHTDFAGFPAIRAIIFAVHAQAHAVLSLAVATVPVALALALLLIALRTKNGGLHPVPSFVRNEKRSENLAQTMMTSL
jgi:hypothetical protein